MAFPSPQSPIVWVARKMTVQYTAGSPIVTSPGTLLYVPPYPVAIKNVVVGSPQSDPLAVDTGAPTQVSILIVTQRIDAPANFSAYDYIGPLAQIVLGLWTTGRTFGSGILQRMVTSYAGDAEAILWPNDGVDFGYRGLHANCDAGTVAGSIHMRWEESRVPW